ncbi:MAG: TlpA family protein disulfide reductase [Selenomonadaceae bacterium]|nr:TlpA family protein disulfide reductase [Selenomonadaceae bacterium]
MKKFLAAVCIASFLISGCGGDSANDNSTKSAQASSIAKNMPDFKTKSITGEIFTKEIFASKKITMINIWGTFCPPCIAEMPELGEMARSLPADAQIIGIICDADEFSNQQIKEALRITKEAHVNFVNLVLDEQLVKFLENIDAVPTTIFVNSKGEIVGEMIVGADVDGYKDELEKLLKD